MALMRVRPYGLQASIIDRLPTSAPAALRELLLAECSRHTLHCVDVIPAASSVVVTHDAGDGEQIREIANGVIASAALRNIATHRHESPVIEIPVRYDGADMADVATACSLSIDEVVTLHCSTTLVVEFCGFSPGFAYLRGLPAPLHLPRRASPRARVPAGSVAIAAHYAAVYPSDSPGGWHLLGTTTLKMWDSTRGRPSLLQPGDRVRFVRVD